MSDDIIIEGDAPADTPDAPDIVVAPVIVNTPTPEPAAEPADEDAAADAETVSLIALALTVGNLAGQVTALDNRVTALETVPEEIIEDGPESVIDENGDIIGEVVSDDDGEDRIAPRSTRPHPLFRTWRDWRQN